MGWNKEEFKSYLGPIDTKEVLADYKFCICYENISNINGYVTEKIFDCFQYGCVPVYLGADNITKYVPENCFIDRRKFKDEMELYHFLKNMKEEEYQDYIDHIKAFLVSDQAKLFTPENLLKTFREALNL